MESNEEGVGLRLRKASLKPISIEKSERGSSGGAIGEEEPLSPGSRLFHEPDFNVHVIAVMGIKSHINPDVVKAKLADTLLKHPRFSSLQVKDEKNDGEMKWVRSNANIDDHVIVPTLDQTIESPDQYVEGYISNLSKTSLDHSKPLWELHVLNVKTSDAAASAVFRIHHSLGDGASLIAVLLACTRQISNPSALPTVPRKKKRGAPNSIKNALLAFWSTLVMLWNTFVDVFTFMASGLFLKDTKTPLSNQPGVEHTARRFVYRTVSMDDLKFVKNAMNGTINDVALGVTQAGLSRYLNRKYGEQGRDMGATQKRNNLPNNIRLRSTLLVNLRPAEIEDLAAMMENNTEAKYGNWVGFVLLPFTIGLRDDPLDYIREAKATVDRKKRSYEAIVTFYLADFILKVLGIKRASKMSHNVIANTTLCFSNLAGPLEEIGFYGHPISYIAPGSYGQPHGLMINFQSCADNMTIVLSVDESIVPDPHQLCDDLEESLRLIKDAVVRRSRGGSIPISSVSN